MLTDCVTIVESLLVGYLGSSQLSTGQSGHVAADTTASASRDPRPLDSSAVFNSHSDTAAADSVTVTVDYESVTG